jgi:acetolactate synthase-1/2/3 large subunit
LLGKALEPPRGPVHLDLSAADAAAPADPAEVSPATREAALGGHLDAVLRLLAGARRPALVAGVQARNAAAAAALARLADRLACPVLTTYKAKGVYADGAARHAGLFTGARSEAPWLADCDLLVLYGVDPVELVASPWPYDMAVLELAEAEIRPHYTEIVAAAFGPLPALAQAAAEAARPANWPTDPSPLALPELEGEGDGLSPHAVARAAVAAAPAGTRLTIDAGAHMLPAMALWPARAPFDVQISNGLSTMAFALPAAIATALAEPGVRVLAITGDGGLSMCLGELATAARERVPVTVLVFNDGALSMIDLKQQQRGFASRGVRTAALDFARIAEGAGCRAARADDRAALERALAQAFSGDGPMLIDARVDPSGYRAMFEAIRGAPGAAANT